eukprot:scpid23928/ scgid32293/ Rab GTPase-activating protein 1; GAP and centrosome-associated protein; Rab6 GTPase-activating protein GAPCenA
MDTFPVSTKAERSQIQSPASPVSEMFSVVIPQSSASDQPVASAVRIQPVASRVSTTHWGFNSDHPSDSASGITSRAQTTPGTFQGLMYLGRCAVNQPTSQKECQDVMCQLAGARALKVDLVFPCDTSHAFHIVDQQNGEDLAAFPIRVMVSCVRSTSEQTPGYFGLCVAERQPIATVTNQRFSSDLMVYHCHVLQTSDQSMVSRIIDLMDAVFWNQSIKWSYGKPSTSASPSDKTAAGATERPIEVAFDIREQSTTANQLISVPRSCCGGVLDLQHGVEKEIVVLVVQSSAQPPLMPSRCVGVAIAAGSKVGQSAMNLLEPAALEQVGSTWQSFLVRARWVPSTERDLQLNEVTQPGETICMSIAADVMFPEVADPLRFMKEINVRVCDTHDQLVRSIAMSPVFDLHNVTFRPVDESAESGEAPRLEVEKIDLYINHRSGTAPAPIPRGDRLTLTASCDGIATLDADRSTGLELPRSKSATHAASNTSSATSARSHDSPVDAAAPSPAMHRLFGGKRQVTGSSPEHAPRNTAPPASDEVLLSGAGVSDRPRTYLERKEWTRVIDFLDSEDSSQTLLKDVKEMVHKRGVPEDLRGIVWPVLCGCRGENDNALFQSLQDMESRDEKVIRNDLHRTYTGHRFFCVPGAPGQAAMFAVSKAYSNFDSEVGYCQGLSYIIATLVLHMSTECAFRVLTCIMLNYGLRDLFAVGLSGLKLRLYQLSRLVEDQLPDLHSHLVREEVNVAMFATQWFLSLYASSFGLYFCTSFLDIFLSDGLETIFQMAIALLKLNRRNLQQLEFGGILDYFRHLPKNYLNPDQVSTVLETSASIKISPRKMAKYAKEYDVKVLTETFEQQQIERLQVTVDQLQTTNRSLREKNVRLQEESEGLIKSKIEIRLDMDELEQRMASLAKKHRVLQDQYMELMRRTRVPSIDSEIEPTIPIKISSEDTPSPNLTDRDSEDSGFSPKDSSL